ncbi:hypothetical protein SCHPADRAFT_865168 [Schizopora paradoxa]|uniref:DASH complex subunit DAM1 n=1 Tax=Schizopora paradoxa TaxID=27342 RepID=A0A0H2S517_9AGAM|nr:hypothetical protein SCHPADRAFT_865168 [Schizopora paradoxa]
MPPPQPPRTPLRRVSQGSLRAISRSGTFPDAPHGLGFLEPAMAELADEAEGLQTSVAGLHSLSESLETFNESFASYLHVMEMNSLTTDWPQAPTDSSFLLASKREEDDARAAQAALRAAAEAALAAEKSAAEEAAAEGNTTTFGDTSAATVLQPTGIKQPTGILKKKKPKPKLTVKEKKERNMAIDKTVSALPLEFRGQDPTLRRNVESVIETLMDNSNGLEILAFVKPEINQARVNKCLIALVNRKIVSKDSSSGRILYSWNGVPS